PHHRLPGGKYARAQAGGKVAGGQYFWRADARSGGGRVAAGVERTRRPARAARMARAGHSRPETDIPCALRASRPAGAGEADRRALPSPGGDSRARRIVHAGALTWIFSRATSDGLK